MWCTYLDQVSLHGLGNRQVGAGLGVHVDASLHDHNALVDGVLDRDLLVRDRMRHRADQVLPLHLLKSVNRVLTKHIVRKPNRAQKV